MTDQLQQIGRWGENTAAAFLIARGHQIIERNFRTAAGEIDLPVSTQDGVEVAVDLAGTTYFGLWKNGIASLSFGAR